MGASAAGNDGRVHPFFTTPRPQPLNEEQHGELQAANGSSPVPYAAAGPELALSREGDQSDPQYSEPKRQKRKSEATEGTTGKKRRGRPRKVQQPTDTTREDASVSSQDVQGPLDTSTTNDHTLRETADNIRRSLPPVLPPSCNEVPHNEATTAVVTVPTDANADAGVKPKKMLNFNAKSGTLGSPPNPKETPIKSSPNLKPTKARGTRIAKKLSLVVSVKYGTDEQARLRIGNRIEEILKAQRHDGSVPPATVRDLPATNLPQVDAKIQKQATTNKKTHPFFLAKTQKTSATSEKQAIEKTTTDSTTHKVFSSTPCSPKRPRAQPIDAAQAMGKGQIQFGTRHLGLKIPGACLPPWPWKGAVRIGEDEMACKQEQPALYRSCRKSKGNATLINLDESIITRLTDQLRIPAVVEELRNVDTDRFTPAPRELRLPQKHCESGRKLQERIRSQLKTLEFNLGTVRFFESISSSLAAHDRSQCESQAWAQKYAPASVSDVLQAERETSLLKEWLVALQVQSVDTGADAAPGRGKGGPKGIDAGQKKRKRRKVDNFIVSSDEDDNELNELSEPETESSLPVTGGFSRRTVIRSSNGASSKAGKEMPRLKNAVVISGPHGCGKTAAVYAVAKELGFEVFEISPGSRRNGKDILEKIGDMTRNHLVQHHQASAITPGDEDACVPIDDSVANEVQSGKQATMGSFFKTNTKAKPTPKPQPAPNPAAPTKQSEIKKAPSKIQKQSLILLEEVDILYEEDKNFWTTVMGLMAQSKRPFIMTCNDESLVPLQSLDLHGIFRFNPPPIDVTVDRLLIMAAHEGHALRRDAVESLYVSRGHDMRASIADLNYWCQIGVGDRRGGFDWFYLRWPKGVDQDEAGDIVRVVSEDTYQEGMGWLNRTPEKGAQEGCHGEEALMKQAWDHFGLDIGLWQDSQAMQLWAENCSGSGDRSCAERLAALEAYDSFTDVMSIADLSSAMETISSKELSIDATLPPLPAKAREDFTLGRILIEATPVTSYDALDNAISVCLKAMGKQELRQTRTNQELSSGQDGLAPLEEDQAIPAIRNHLNGPSLAAPAVNRLDFAIAFDPIAVSEEAAAAGPSSHLDPSVWDRTMKIITLDVAPFVRGIVAFDNHLQQQRMKLSNLMSQGGAGPKKRMRTTRAAYSAMEGGQRSTTRAEKWFKADINPYFVKATAPRGCADLVPIPAIIEADERSTAGEIAGLGSSCDESDPAPQPVVNKGRNKLRKSVVGASSDCSEDELAS
ncbi:hypothetical protein MCOR14_000601 [Pyricularia oryzae]|nr:hypothetical protein MCOR11_005645 [Pyricularia oryzae]KAI6545416.1 hypothetical protein MCOR05_001540 [Pyricularia oryzae]KAI6573442.1 hypothetical protein MCOR09_002893 [Pyricularia oryzae]KAI6645021.1 hypothetical protein MCOR14_000601 [Pyricularia oryzae]